MKPCGCSEFFGYEPPSNMLSQFFKCEGCKKEVNAVSEEGKKIFESLAWRESHKYHFKILFV